MSEAITVTTVALPIAEQISFYSLCKKRIFLAEIEKKGSISIQ